MSRICSRLKTGVAVSLAFTLMATPTAVAQSSIPVSSSSIFSSSTSSGSSNIPVPDTPGAATPMTTDVLFREGFDDVVNPARFTHGMPADWQSVTTGVSSGEERWNGWTLATIRDWTWASGTDMRHYFTRGHDQVAIIDSRQQRLNATDSMAAALSTPDIDVSGRDRVLLEFDSNYRQGGPEQYAEVAVAFDGVSREVLRLDADRISSHEAIELEVPAGASTMTAAFTYANGNDDWFWAIDNVAVTSPLGEVTGEPEAIIDIISDIQGDITDYEDAVTQLNELPDQAGALVINGDEVDNGSQELWDEFNAATERTPHQSGTTILTAGNHELYGPEGFETYHDRFLEYSGQENVWSETIIDGVPLITINSEYYSDVDRGGKEPFVRMSREQLDWLDSRLAHWDAEGTPALVFTHYVLPQTVSMSHSAWYQNDFEDLAALSDVLNKYNNIVMFTGHSHASILHQNDWWGMRRYEGTGAAGRQGFPVVNTGAILNAYLPDGDHDETILEGPASSGLRAKVYSDRVRVEAWDFVTGEMIKVQDFPRAR